MTSLCVVVAWLPHETPRPNFSKNLPPDVDNCFGMVLNIARRTNHHSGDTDMTINWTEIAYTNRKAPFEDQILEVRWTSSRRPTWSPCPKKPT